MGILSNGKMAKRRKLKTRVLFTFVVFITITMFRDTLQYLLAWDANTDHTDYSHPFEEGHGNRRVQRTMQSENEQQLSSNQVASMSDNSTRLVLFLGSCPHHCGESLAAQLVTAHPDAFSVPEPALGVYTALYGVRARSNADVDIFNRQQAQRRNIPQFEIDALATVFKNLLLCQPDHVPTEVFVHLRDVIKTQPARHHHTNTSSMTSFVTCLQQRRVTTKNCRAIIKPYCDSRASDATEDMTSRDACRRFLWDVRQHPADYNRTHWNVIKTRFAHQLRHISLGESAETVLQAFELYHSCMQRVSDKLQDCLPIYSDACHEASTRSITTAHVTMQTAAKLLRHVPQLRVVHVMRDPRAVAVLGGRNPPNVDGHKSPNLDGKTVKKQLVTEASTYCTRVLNDVHVRQSLTSSHPQTFMQVLYEQLTSEPPKTIRKFYEFLRISPVPHHVFDWFAEHSALLANTSSQQQSWRSALSSSTSRQIHSTCSALYQVIDSKLWNNA